MDDKQKFDLIQRFYILEKTVEIQSKTIRKMLSLSINTEGTETVNAEAIIERIEKLETSEAEIVFAVNAHSKFIEKLSVQYRKLDGPARRKK